MVDFHEAIRRGIATCRGEADFISIHDMTPSGRSLSGCRRNISVIGLIDGEMGNLTPSGRPRLKHILSRFVT